MLTGEIRRALEPPAAANDPPLHPHRAAVWSRSRWSFSPGGRWCALHIEAYLLPGPDARRLGDVRRFRRRQLLAAHIAATRPKPRSSASSSAASSAARCSACCSRNQPTFERFLWPLIVALQAMPKVALAPLILVWCGFGLESKVVLIVLICFFPLFVNVVVGIRSADANLIESAAPPAPRAGTIFAMSNCRRPPATSLPACRSAPAWR